jgi:hypothetical protein
VFTCEWEIKKLIPAEDSLIVGCENKICFLDRKTGEVEQEYNLDKPLIDLAFKGGDVFIFLPGEVICLPPYLYPRWKRSLRYDNFLLDTRKLFLYDGFSIKSIACIGKMEKSYGEKSPLCFSTSTIGCRMRITSIYSEGGGFTQENWLGLS